MRAGNLQELFRHIVFLDLEIDGQKGFRRESRKSLAINAGFLLFGWSALPNGEDGNTGESGCGPIAVEANVV